MRQRLGGIVQITPDRKVYVAGFRWHHGLLGAQLVLFGIYLILTDWADRWWSPLR